MRALLLLLLLSAIWPRLAPAVCVGDCNGIDGVTIDEVQHATNIFLGTSDVSTCLNADRDSDAHVSIDEVQATVNSFLSDPNSCPTVRVPSATPTASGAEVLTTTPTAVPIQTGTPTPTFSATPSAMPIATSTSTATRTSTRTFTRTLTRTATRTATSSPTPTSTPTPVATATPKPPMCGNGVLERGETCTSCAADCVAHPCTASGATVTFAVSFAPPLGETASSVTTLVGYRSDLVSLPGSGTGACQGGSKNGKVCMVATDCPGGQCVLPPGSCQSGANSGKSCTTGTDCPGGQCILPRSRIKNTPPATIVGVTDLDYAVRVVLTRSTQLTPGAVFTIDFDTCQGAAAPTAADFGCNVTGCASSFGNVDGCTCAVTNP
jgi:hypothetical protein